MVTAYSMLALARLLATEQQPILHITWDTDFEEGPLLTVLGVVDLDPLYEEDPAEAETASIVAGLLEQGTYFSDWWYLLDEYITCSPKQVQQQWNALSHPKE